MTLILGIDPGLQRTGWGIISIEGNRLRFIASGVIASEAAAPLADRLLSLHHGLMNAVTLYKPNEAAVEETFVNVNGASTLKLGQARGAIMLTLSQAGLSVNEYAATLVKKSVVGVGRAEKRQVSAMVGMLLPGCGKMGADAADALAVAICHANHRERKKLEACS